MITTKEIELAQERDWWRAVAYTLALPLVGMTLALVVIAWR
jgi:hypothetical protein